MENGANVLAPVLALALDPQHEAAVVTHEAPAAIATMTAADAIEEIAEIEVAVGIAMETAVAIVDVITAEIETAVVVAVAVAETEAVVVVREETL